MAWSYLFLSLSPLTKRSKLFSFRQNKFLWVTWTREGQKVTSLPTVAFPRCNGTVTCETHDHRWWHPGRTITVPTSGAWPPQGWLPGERKEEWLVTIPLTTKVLSCGCCWEDKGSILASWTGCLFLLLWLPPPLVTQEMGHASSFISTLKFSISASQVSIIQSATPVPPHLHLTHSPPSFPGCEDPVCFPYPVKGAPFQAFPLSSITFMDLFHSLWWECLHFSPSPWFHKYGWAFSSYLLETLNKSKMLQINARY